MKIIILQWWCFLLLLLRCLFVETLALHAELLHHFCSEEFISDRQGATLWNHSWRLHVCSPLFCCSPFKKQSHSFQTEELLALWGCVQCTSSLMDSSVPSELSPPLPADWTWPSLSYGYARSTAVLQSMFLVTIATHSGKCLLVASSSVADADAERCSCPI